MDQALTGSSWSSAGLLVALTDHLAAAFRQRATLTPADALQQLFHRTRPFDCGVHFRDLVLRERAPSFGHRGPGRETFDQLARFSEREPARPRELHDRELGDCIFVVVAPAAAPRRRREQAQLLVIADGRCPKRSAPCELTDGHGLSSSLTLL